jgi:hypothetical protein
MVTMIFAVLAGGIAAAADSDVPTAAAPVVVSGTLDCDVDAATDASSVTDVNVHSWQASDPRLEGQAAYTGHWQIYTPPAEDSGSGEPASAAYAIVNDGGSWLCTETRTSDPPRTEADRHTLVFTGEGDYAGYTAYLQVDFSQTPYAFSGLILEGEAPPYAEPQG